MNIVDTQKKILTDNVFVLSETEKIQYLYGLKHEIRYDLERAAADYSESVAEHIYAMHIISDYFLPLEDPENKLDIAKVKTMITWHDMDELETGDKISWKKTAADIESEKTAWKAVLPHLPELVRDTVILAVEEYENLSTPEAKFVKGIDKIEPLFHMYNAKGKAWSLSMKMTRYDADRIKLKYIEQFPYMQRFTSVVHDAMEAEGFFTT